ncbi:regulatory signaling modulator protein AmpE [Marinobacter sp. CHS3-4]|uniref:regulatory signaling modulator protein AmpE n=1 Tax=Marinobacter sp. CHS3-4 TaxID=3045174 RepID=UPI0024B49B50|nr:regulatory signaling modulator protein AmpE [Marinobacter sp. CHS3-4]MDI9246861.1 regulatory signaling modulator protein AmpE [Marinobacter sp. CHS3-4]
MEFLVFLAAYILRRKCDQAGLLQGDALWRSSFANAHTVQPGKESHLLRGLLTIAIPAVLLAAGEYLLREAGWSLLVHPLGFVLLLVLMGAPGLTPMLESYTEAWRRGDMQAAWIRVRDFLPVDERGAASSPEQMHRSLSKRLIAQIFERYFVIAFWYVIGGLAGAFVSRALIALRDHWPHAAARPGFGRLANALNFLPARLLGLTFGIAGDLSGWLKQGQSSLLNASRPNSDALLASASSALSGYELEPERFSQLHPDNWPDFAHSSVAAIRGLLNRSMLVWICLLALLVIAGVI